MAEAKSVHVLGVHHITPYINKSLAFLLARVKPGQSVGLEITKGVAAEHEAMFKAMARNPNLSFEQAFRPHLINHVRQVYLDLGVPQKEIEKYVRKFKKMSKQQPKTYEMQLKLAQYFFELHKALAEKGVKVVPLEKEVVSRQKAVQGFKREGGDVRAALLFSFLDHPIRERWMVEKMAVKPDFMVVGSSHAREVKRLLKEQGFKVKTSFIPFKARLQASPLLSGATRRTDVFRKVYRERREKRKQARKKR